MMMMVVTNAYTMYQYYSRFRSIVLTDTTPTTAPHLQMYDHAQLQFWNDSIKISMMMGVMMTVMVMMVLDDDDDDDDDDD